MTLNNKGWGLKEMLFFSAILFFCLLVVVVLINNLYSGIEENMGADNHSTKKYTYEQVEKNLNSAAKRYYKTHKDEIGEILISDELIDEDYLTVEKMTVDNDICEGYVLIEDDAFKPFITCTNYETEGY